jgi:hypothetical protein
MTALDILADGKWHHYEEFSCSALSGVQTGLKLNLFMYSHDGVRLSATGAELLKQLRMGSGMGLTTVKQPLQG